MNERERIAWLDRRVGFGSGPGALDARAGSGAAAVLDGLFAPAAAPDPWAAVPVATFDNGGDNRAKQALYQQTVAAWLVAMATTPDPFGEWLRWFWHGHFVSTLRVVRFPQLMVQQLQLFGRQGLGDFRSLLHSVTIDPAMLIYLDGTTSRKGAVNENYGREVLELFALGIGNYTEADVRAAAEALTGWRTERPAKAQGVATFDPKRHDDAPKAFLGRTVHDVDTVIDAIVAHPACAPFVTRALAEAILGPAVDGSLVQRLSTDFAASGLQLRPLVRAILDAGLDGDASRELVLAPVPWLAMMIRSTGVPAEQVVTTFGERGLVAAGQVPMDAPNVAGWPDRRAWLSSSATVARFNMAAGLAPLVPAEAAARVHAQAGDLDALADDFGRPAGFSAATTKALHDLYAATPGDRRATAVLTVAMASPDLVMA